MRKAFRRTIAIGVLLAISALVIDRVALYWYGFRVLHLARVLRRNLHFVQGHPYPVNPHQPFAIIDDPRPKDIGSGWVYASFEGGLIRPDRVDVEPYGVEFGFTPPALAWTTRLFPSGSQERPSVVLYELGIAIQKEPHLSGEWIVGAFQETWHHRRGMAPDALFPGFWYPYPLVRTWQNVQESPWSPFVAFVIAGLCIAIAAVAVRRRIAHNDRR